MRFLIHRESNHMINKLMQRYKAYIVCLSKKQSRRGLYEFLWIEFNNIFSDANVLSIGAGGEINTLLSCYADKNKFTVSSFDINPDRAPDILGDICRSPLPENHYDFVVMCEVLEHIYEPKSALENIHSSLKSDGKFIISTPYCLPIHDSPHDYFRYTKYGLLMLLHNFRDVKVRERDSYFEAIDTLWLRLIFEDSKSANYIGLIIAPLIFLLKRPITKILTKIAPTQGITTGYVVTSIK
jgi:SAM-dependent methyltransferase